MDGSIEFLCVDMDVKRSLKSTSIVSGIFMPSSCETVLEIIFPSSIASEAAKISAAGTLLTGLLNL